MSDSKTTPYDDEREKRIQEIQDLLFKEKSPEKIHDFLNNFFTESRDKALKNNTIPKSPELTIKPILRSKTYEREFSINNLYSNKKSSKPAQPTPIKQEEDSTPPVIQNLINEEKTKKKKTFKKQAKKPVQDKKEKGVFIDHKTTMPKKTTPPLPELKPKKKSTKVQLEKEATAKQSPVKQNKKIKKEVKKPVKKAKEKNLDESFKKRQKKLSDMLNNKDEGQVT